MSRYGFAQVNACRSTGGVPHSSPRKGCMRFVFLTDSRKVSEVGLSRKVFEGAHSKQG